MQVCPAIRLSPVLGFPILPVLDYVPRLVLLDPRSPVFRPGFPIRLVPDYVPHLVPLDPRSPVFLPGFPILPVPDYVLRPVLVDLLDEVKIGISLYFLVSESCFWVLICQSPQ